MPQTRITVISSSGEEQLLLEISYELDADGFENKMVLSTEYRGKAISAVGIHYPFEDTFSDLQNKLPEGVLLKACVSCRHGNLCPVGSDINEVFCTKNVEITKAEDLWQYTEDPSERAVRSRTFNDCCPDFAAQTKEHYTYSDWQEHLNQ